MRAARTSVRAFDNGQQRLQEYRARYDPMREFSEEDLKRFQWTRPEQRHNLGREFLDDAAHDSESETGETADIGQPSENVLDKGNFTLYGESAEWFVRLRMQAALERYWTYIEKTIPRERGLTREARANKQKLEWIRCQRFQRAFMLPLSKEERKALVYSSWEAFTSTMHETRDRRGLSFSALSLAFAEADRLRPLARERLIHDRFGQPPPPGVEDTRLICTPVRSLLHLLYMEMDGRTLARHPWAAFLQWLLNRYVHNRPWQATRKPWPPTLTEENLEDLSFTLGPNQTLYTPFFTLSFGHFDEGGGGYLPSVQVRYAEEHGHHAGIGHRFYFLIYGNHDVHSAEAGKRRSVDAWGEMRRLKTFIDDVFLRKKYGGRYEEEDRDSVRFVSW